MQDAYDIVILGTGLTECILSNLLSIKGKKILHLDKNSYYGGSSASLSIEQLWQYFHENLPMPKYNRKYSIDLLSKFLLADGKMLKLLVHTTDIRYFDLKPIDSNYIVKDTSILKIPTSKYEALKTSVIGCMEKLRFKDYIMFCIKYNLNNTKTLESTSVLLNKYNLSVLAQNVIGHAICLYTDNNWQNNPAIETINRTKLYINSLGRYGDSPYLYPVNGIGDFCYSFARLATINGAYFILNEHIQNIIYDRNHHVKGILVDNNLIHCKNIIGSPNYFDNEVINDGQIIRCINILNHPIMPDKNSMHIIIPGYEASRKNNIYISCVSNMHGVAPEGYYIAIITTKVETTNPKHEIKYALDMLGDIIYQFWNIESVFTPINNTKNSGIHISKSYDDTNNFETVIDDVIRLYKEITGETNVDYLFEI